MIVSQINRSYKGEDEKFKTLLSDAHNIITDEIKRLRRMVEHSFKFATLPTPVLKNKPNR